MGKMSCALIGRRLWQLLPIVVFATFVVFSLLQLVPGDPAVVLAGDYASEQRIAEIRQLYGLDQPFVVQYGVWLLHALEGNLGRSLLTSQSVVGTDPLPVAEHDSDRGLRAGDRRRWSACRSACWQRPASARGSTRSSPALHRLALRCRASGSR